MRSVNPCFFAQKKSPDAYCANEEYLKVELIKSEKSTRFPRISGIWLFGIFVVPLKVLLNRPVTAATFAFQALAHGSTQHLAGKKSSTSYAM
jgi:hypothetical protein